MRRTDGERSADAWRAGWMHWHILFILVFARSVSSMACDEFLCACTPVQLRPVMTSDESACGAYLIQECMRYMHMQMYEHPCAELNHVNL